MCDTDSLLIIGCPFCERSGKLVYSERKFIGWDGAGIKHKKFSIYVTCPRCHSRGPLVTSDTVAGCDPNSSNPQEREVSREILAPYARKAISGWNRRVSKSSSRPFSKKVCTS